MKFDYKLNYYENRKARFNYQRSLTASTPYQPLNEEEHKQLLALNERLTLLEEQYLPILNAKHIELQKQVNNPENWIQEFNLEIVITFYLREDDPEYEDEDDNILMQIPISHCDYNAEGIERKRGFGMTNINHCDFIGAENEDEHHCYLYHDLYDHCGLDWRDLLRIGSLYVEIKIDEQSGMLPFIQVKT